MKNVLVGISMIVFLPIIMTFFISGREGCSLHSETEVEEYVMFAAAMQIPWNYGEEAIKAQCVIARTNLYREMQAGGKGTLQEAAIYFKDAQKREHFREHFLVFQNAAKETEGEILIWQQEAVELPFFRVSAGRTRSGEEVLGSYYAYLPSILVEEDKESGEYLQGFYFTLEELKSILQGIYPDFSWKTDENGGGKGMEEQIYVMSTDSAGYVMEIQVGNHIFQGEELRQYLELSSSCFSVQFAEEQVRFLCKGLGHGLGFSQYAANTMGTKGADYKEMLLRFYPGIECIQITNLKN